MKKIKLFLEFVSAGKESVFLPLTYGEIAAKLGCGVEEVEEFEEYLDQNIKPGESFHGSFDSTEHDDEDAQVDIFDQIEDEGDYMLMWKKYKNIDKVHSAHHDDDGL
jgi:hypothetical protein